MTTLRKRPGAGQLFRILACFAAPLAVAADSPRVDFIRDVQPILAGHCTGCHGPEKAKSGLKLTTRETAVAPAKSGKPAIVPGKPEESEMIRRVASRDPEERMPPREKAPLTPEQVERLERWIREGAGWQAHWAYRPIDEIAPPRVRGGDWARSEIDLFILAKLEEHGIAPSPGADRYTLAKRLSYDLLGLPLAVEEVDAFVDDSSPGAYERLVDRLLASPHFGERWGRHWLDMARFADSDGYEKDRARPDAYVFRDWVIDAVNRDMPFDRFTVEQIAGDLLPGATSQQKIATAFNRQTLTNEEGGVDQEEFRVAAAFDRVETLGTVWLGLTIGCVRCHGHKYDPIPHEDYYRLFAFFNDGDETLSRVPFEANRPDELEAKLQPLEEALAARHAELAPAALEWETEEHRRILGQPVTALEEHPLEVTQVQSAAGVDVKMLGDSIVAAAADEDTLTVTARSPVPEVTGFKLWTLAGDSLPGKGPGHSKDGNFVLTRIEVFLLAEGQPPRRVELHRAQSDHAQAGFEPKNAIEGDGAGRSGWAIGGQTGKDHWIQIRTREPLRVENAALRFVFSERHGKRHTLGRFRIAALTGNVRGLHISDRSIADALEMYPEKRVASTRQNLFDHYAAHVAKDEQALSLRGRIASLIAKHGARTMEVRTIGRPLVHRPAWRFDRGDFLSPQEQIEAGTPAILHRFEPRGPQPGESRKPDRLDLARWLVSPESFLAPRVAVNQVWMHLFGAALVRTANDFGVRGEPPSHPEMLDWLAAQFSGRWRWSRKALIRAIVTSAAYRQASRHRPELVEIDPANTLLGRQNRFRVEAEVVRDVSLAASGLLAFRIGGPSVFPPMPEDLAKLSYANNFTWKTSEGDDRYRRGMYTFFKRTIPHPSLMTFDCPEANVTCVTRTPSNTPLQALLLLNNEVHVEAARAFARRLLEKPAATDAERVGGGFRICVARPPGATEVSALSEALDAARRYYLDHEEEAGRLIGPQGPRTSPGHEVAAWVIVARVLLNLDEIITRE